MADVTGPISTLPGSPGTIMYAVLCDGEIYMINRIEKNAKGTVAAFSHGSKHKWDFCRVRVVKHRRQP